MDVFSSPGNIASEDKIPTVVTQIIQKIRYKIIEMICVQMIFFLELGVASRQAIDPLSMYLMTSLFTMMMIKIKGNSLMMNP